MHLPPSSSNRKAFVFDTSTCCAPTTFALPPRRRRNLADVSACSFFFGLQRLQRVHPTLCVPTGGNRWQIRVVQALHRVPANQRDQTVRSRPKANAGQRPEGLGLRRPLQLCQLCFNTGHRSPRAGLLPSFYGAESRSGAAFL